MGTKFPTFRRLLGQRIYHPFAWPWRTSLSQRQGLLRMIAVSNEERIPLVPLLNAWLSDERGAQQYRLNRLVNLLDQGVPIADAVEQVPGVLNDEDILAIRFDSQNGTVTQAIRNRLAQPGQVESERSPRVRSTIYYFWVMLLLGTPIVAFLQIKIVPAFRQIFEEFSLGLPPVTERFITISELLVHWLPAVFIIALVLSIVFAWPGRGARRTLTRLFSPLRVRYRANLLRLIGIAISAGRPISSAVSTLARYHFDSTIRHKLLFVRNEIEQGADPWDSMRDVELLSNADVRALQLADRIGNRSWVLNQLASAKVRHSTQWLNRLSEFALPAAVLAMGVFVFFQFLALFAPLVNLIYSLAA
jgi:type II secretory pathway component PulF